MVSYIRCPYCGHPEVAPNALYCPACDGEIHSEQTADQGTEMPELGSLSSSSSKLDLEELLNLTGDASESDDVLNLSAKAPTLDPVSGISGVPIELQSLGASAEKTSEFSGSPNVSVPNAVSKKKQKSMSGGWAGRVFVLLVLICIGGLIFAAKSGDEPSPTKAAEVDADAKFGLEALAQERYGAAIKYLEKAIEADRDPELLPSLALAYSRTGQLERSREVMRSYRIGRRKHETNAKEGGP